MLLHILRKDLKRKRTMNIILFLFILLATTFLAASVNNFVTITGAVDNFFEVAKVPDCVMMVLSETKSSPLDAFLEDCSYVTEYEVQDMYTLVEDEIEIVSCADDPDKHVYEKGNLLMIEAVPEIFSKVFDEKDRPLALNPGEIALPRQQAELNGLKKGDRIQISGPGKTMEFTIASIMKDAVLGAEMIGAKRLIIGKEDYEILMGEQARYHTLYYQINCSDAESFLKELKKQNIENIMTVEKSILKMCYFFDMLMAGILVVAGICMILISFLILRFTIVFTLQEDYKEIGIMKAIGIRDIRIKGIYLLKYFAIALVGAAAGTALSIPFGDLLLSRVMERFVALQDGSGMIINLACSGLIVLIVVGFCYSCTGKIRKYTAIEAIRNGGNGERYNTGGKLSLHKQKWMCPSVYLACNDVAAHMRRYLVLAVIFCIGTLEILLPLTAVHTLKDENIVRNFSVQPSSFYIDTGHAEAYIAQKDDTLIKAEMQEIREKLEDEGIRAEVWVELWYTLPCYGTDIEKQMSNTTYTMQQIGKSEDDYDVLEGSLPILDNEVMVTEKTAEDLGVSIGDSLYYQFPEGEKEFIITGTYQSMMNMGYGIRVGRAAKMPYQIGGTLAFQVLLEEEREMEKMQERLQGIFPDYKIKTSGEWMNSMVGIMEQLDTLQLFITVIVLFLNILITVLMVKTLIAREHGEIAMLKSIGFADRTIRGWQSIRIVIVLVISILAGTLLTGILDSVLIGAVFSVMGATKIALVRNPLESYLIYPLILIMATGAASYLCAAEVKKVDLKEINTIE